MIDAMPKMPWDVFLWYMAGAACRGAVTWLSWLQAPRSLEEIEVIEKGQRGKAMVSKRGGVTWLQQLARSAKAVIGSAAVAFVWTGGHMLPVLAVTRL